MRGEARVLLHFKTVLMVPLVIGRQMNTKHDRWYNHSGPRHLDSSLSFQKPSLYTGFWGFSLINLPPGLLTLLKE